MELHEITTDVYACLQEDTGLGKSNSGLINRAGGLVIDTFWDLPSTRELIRQYGRVWKRPARRVLNTHHNGDHCWGNQLFSDAEIIGHRRCAESFGKERPEIMQAARRMVDSDDAALAAFARALAPFDFSGITLTPPTRLIDNDVTLDLDGLRVDLLYVGPAHTAGDVIAHLPEQRVVFTGDVLFRLCTPIGWEGTFANWTKALDRIIDLRPDVVVPGHGPLGGIEGPREMRDYLTYVRAEAARSFAAELPLLEAAKRIDLGPYAGWTEPERLVFNVARAYRELRGEPYDAQIDMAGLFRAMFELRQHWASRAH
jgi:cyclase